MRFWSRSTPAVSIEPPTPPPAANLVKEQPESFTMSMMKHLENAMETIVSAVMTPVANLKYALSNSNDSALSRYAPLIAVVFAACAVIAFLYSYGKSFKLFRKSFRNMYKKNEDDEEDSLDEDDEDDDEDEEEDESDDSDYSRGRGDRPRKKYQRSSYTSKTSTRRQKRRR